MARLRHLPALLLLLCIGAACVTVPYTQRSQLILLSEADEISLGGDAYREVLRNEKIVHDPELTGLVVDVGERIAAVAEKPGYRWEFKLIDDADQVNAFALPGGKVAVYTGLMPVARDTAGLAAVMGHEVAHALARHAGERISQGMLLEVGAAGLAVGLGDMAPASRDAIMQAFGLGAQVGVILPFGRSQEAEADRIGLILMAKAGYDPGAALALWSRFEETNEARPPEFLSTHPSYGTRQRNIRSWLPEARSHFRPDAAVQVVVLPPVR